MAYRRISDEPGIKNGADFTTWRCGHCRALCVTRNGGQPPTKCGKCHR